MQYPPDPQRNGRTQRRSQCRGNIRQRALGRRVAANTDMTTIRELRRIGGLLKHIHNESGGAYSQLTADTLVEIQKAIVSIGNGL
jgi:hypothetical protein